MLKARKRKPKRKRTAAFQRLWDQLKEPALPKGPQGQKRPADQNQLGKRIVEIAASEEGDDKETGAAESGWRGGVKGGAQRAAKLSPERRAEIAKEAAEKRWRKG